MINYPTTLKIDRVKKACDHAEGWHCQVPDLRSTQRARWSPLGTLVDIGVTAVGPESQNAMLNSTTKIVT